MGAWAVSWSCRSHQAPRTLGVSVAWSDSVPSSTNFALINKKKIEKINISILSLKGQYVIFIIVRSKEIQNGMWSSIILFHLGYSVTLHACKSCSTFRSSMLAHPPPYLNGHSFVNTEKQPPLFWKPSGWKQNKELQSSPMKWFHIILPL